jgi:hypothetical protein
MHTATGLYNLVISTTRCERNHGYVKSRIRLMRGLKSFARPPQVFRALDGLQLGEANSVAGTVAYRLITWMVFLPRGSTVCAFS